MVSRVRRRRPLLGVAVVAVVLLAGVVPAGCAAPPGDAAGPAGGSATGRGEVIVVAAASLRATFTELGAQFEAAHPGVTVTLSFGGSADLVAQLQQGAPGDVLATADRASMDRAAGAGLLAGAAQPFATNTMTIAVPAGNPAGITGFADLAEGGLAVVVCAPQVPCGAATGRVESAAGVTLAPVSEEGSVTDVLGKVASGQADAGVVYTTDLAAAGQAVEGVAISAELNTTNVYPIAVLAGGADQVLAGQFRDLVRGEQGQQVLSAAGFGAPWA